ncbi:MAG: prepilin-type N-terminal cleavage/methylation domain-containing protein [Lentisphaerae bacterium]|nr:prepilin-type N-terminal cleavage/methylation domain-containing protein [Lentisphaerota bacterium]HPX40115.1 prepilin-type N-terminal cleavage/methylation domain-containing protein [Candidatus Hydrogenedentota bacterium]
MMKRKVFGFTLIELLVVIAIIAMLAAILVPAVNRALINAALTQTVANGGNIYKSVFAGQMEDVVFAGSSSSWPADGDFDSSSDYFQDLAEREVLNVPPSFFSARGLDRAEAMEDLDDSNNAWRLVLGLGSVTEGVPFLYTQNCTLTALPTSEGTIELDETQEPFRGDGMVVVHKGGSAFSLRGSQLKNINFNPPMTNSADIAIVGP